MNIKLLNKVWNGIKDGKYKHAQTSWHCGTAHCIAGWIEMLATKEGHYGEDGQWKGTCGKNPVLGVLSTGEYAAEKLGIDTRESQLLFHSSMSNDGIQEMVDTFQSGYRYKEHTSYIDEGRIKYAETYWGGEWMICASHLYIPVTRKCNEATMLKKIKKIWGGDLVSPPYMDKTIFTDTFQKCITVELGS